MIVNQLLTRALRMLLIAVVWAAALGSAAAQTAAVGTSPSLQGKTTDGKNFQLSQLQGKVVMVMFWSTDCAVCRDKMRELRANYAGWAGKPFELVLVSTDRRMKDIEAYDKIISQSVPLQQRFVSLWSGASGFKQSFGDITQLPSTFVLDQKGKVVDSYLGRVPAEAWDKVAELL
jgi:peroxiredoxin